MGDDKSPPAPPNVRRMSETYIGGIGHAGDDGTFEVSVNPSLVDVAVEVLV